MSIEQLNCDIAVRNQEKEIERLQKYEKLVWYIANDYHELSHDKAKWQRDDWKKRCKDLMLEDIVEEIKENEGLLEDVESNLDF